MPRPFISAGLVAVVASAVTLIASPAGAGEPEPPYEYETCYTLNASTHVTGQLTTIKACPPVWP